MYTIKYVYYYLLLNYTSNTAISLYQVFFFRCDKVKRKFLRTPKKNQSTSPPILSGIDKTIQYDKFGTDDTLGKPAITTPGVITLKCEVCPELTRINAERQCPKNSTLKPYKKSAAERQYQKKLSNSGLLKRCIFIWKKPYMKAYKLNDNTRDRLIAETAIMTWVGPETKPSDAVQFVYEKFFKKGYKYGFKTAYQKAYREAFKKADKDLLGFKEVSIPNSYFTVAQKVSCPTDAPGTMEGSSPTETSGMSPETEPSNDETLCDKDPYKKAYNDPLNIKYIGKLIKSYAWRDKKWWIPETKLSNVEGLSDDDVFAKFFRVGYKNGFKQAYNKTYNEACMRAYKEKTWIPKQTIRMHPTDASSPKEASVPKNSSGPKESRYVIALKSLL